MKKIEYSAPWLKEITGIRMMKALCSSVTNPEGVTIEDYEWED